MASAPLVQPNRKRSVACATAMLLVLLLGASGRADAKQTIVYYDPDGNHQAILAITTRLNAYLHSRQLAVEFQPVQSEQAFASVMAKDSSAFAIVSALALRSNLGKALGLKPLLVPSAQGSVHYHKVLVSLSKSELKSLDGVSIAVAVIDKNPQRAARAVLKLLVSARLTLGKPVVIPVSKDIDALLALSFRQAQAALVTPKSVQILKRINPSLAPLLRLTHTTKKLLRSPLCAVAGRAGASATAQVQLAFVEMSKVELGKKALALLGFQQWVRYEERMGK